MTFKFIYEPLNIIIKKILIESQGPQEARTVKHAYTCYFKFLQIYFRAFDLKINGPYELITKIYVSLVHVIFH